MSQNNHAQPPMRVEDLTPGLLNQRLDQMSEEERIGYVQDMMSRIMGAEVDVGAMVEQRKREVQTDPIKAQGFVLQHVLQSYLNAPTRDDRLWFHRLAMEFSDAVHRDAQPPMAHLHDTRTPEDFCDGMLDEGCPQWLRDMVDRVNQTK